MINWLCSHGTGDVTETVIAATETETTSDREVIITGASHDLPQSRSANRPHPLPPPLPRRSRTSHSLWLSRPATLPDTTATLEAPPLPPPLLPLVLTRGRPSHQLRRRVQPARASRTAGDSAMHRWPKRLRHLHHPNSQHSSRTPTEMAGLRPPLGGPPRPAVLPVEVVGTRNRLLRCRPPPVVQSAAAASVVVAVTVVVVVVGGRRESRGAKDTRGRCPDEAPRQIRVSPSHTLPPNTTRLATSRTLPVEESWQPPSLSPSPLSPPVPPPPTLSFLPNHLLLVSPLWHYNF